MLSVFATQGIDGSYNLTQAGYLLIIAVIIAAIANRMRRERWEPENLSFQPWLLRLQQRLP